MWPVSGPFEVRQPGVTVVKAAWADAIDEVLNGITGGTHSLKALYLDGIGWQASAITDGLQVDVAGTNVLNVHLAGLEMANPGGKISSVANVEAGVHVKALFGNVQSMLAYVIGRRIAAENYTPLIVGDVALANGFGVGATVTSVAGGDAAGTVTVQSGAAPANVATATIALKDGAYPASSVALVCYGAHQIGALYPSLSGELSGGNLVIAVAGTLSPNQSYTFNWWRVGY